MEQQHSKALETARAEHTASAASTRAALERVHAERTRTAIAQLRADAERDAKNADRKLREVTTRVSENVHLYNQVLVILYPTCFKIFTRLIRAHQGFCHNKYVEVLCDSFNAQMFFSFVCPYLVQFLGLTIRFAT